MKIKNDKEIIIGKAQRGDSFSLHEMPFFVMDIRQLCFRPYENGKYRYSVVIYSAFSDSNETIFISKETYDYLQNKLGANEDELQRVHRTSISRRS